VWTKDSLYVARPNDSTVIDSIPLNEIHAVMEMNEEPDYLKTNQQSFYHRLKNNIQTDKKDEAEAPTELEVLRASQGSSFFSRSSKKNCVLQIKTALDGVVAGRTIYLSTRTDPNPEQRRQAVVVSLNDAAVIAQKKALAMSRFQKAQERVRMIQGSLPFQVFMAALIMLVNNETGRTRL
jgi:hypothetical protein